MTTTSRVLDPSPVTSLAEHERLGGGRGLHAAVEQGVEATLAVLDESGLRGRGGGGFPTGTKWRTVLGHTVAGAPPEVVVNAAEGEPGSFKDRALLRTNPYRVLEGALIAAFVVGADRIVVATKAAFDREVARLREAIDEVVAAGWAPSTAVDVVTGPDAYLFGEETALLEVVDGRMPFPRIAPPWRQGLDLVPDDSAASADIELGAPEVGSPSVTPALVNNVETFAHVAQIVANGPAWFRELGTEASPGTIVCTITGGTHRAGVAEVPLGTPLDQVVEAVGGGPRRGDVVAVMSGVANRLLPGDRLSTPLTYEDMAAAGSGLGTGGFVVLDESTDPLAVVQGASRFLAIESCGQCTPCKQDGLALAEALDRVRTHTGVGDEADLVLSRLRTIEDGARCFLATQHRQVVESILELFPDCIAAHQGSAVEVPAPYLVSELVDIVDGEEGPEAVLDERHRQKQPDWSYDPETSGQSPADRFDQALHGGAEAGGPAGP